MSSMQMSHMLSQRLEQKLKLTASMIQSIEMLQLPLMVLVEQINQELVENPALEVDEADEPEEQTAEKERKDEEFERLDEMSQDDDWGEYLDGPRGARRGGDDPKRDAIENTAAPGVTLREDLDAQFAIADLDERTRALADFIIGNIDDNGYLPYTLEQVFEAENAAAAEAARTGAHYSGPGPVQPEEAQAALRLIQSLDPPGVGARTVEECLLLQLERAGESDSLAATIVRRCFDDVLHNRLPKVAKDLSLSMEQVQEAIERMRHLSLRPGLAYAAGPSRYIIPDVIVEEVEGGYEIRLNDRHIPRLRVSEAYRQMLQGAPRESEEAKYLREKVQSARWLIDAIEQRRSTLEKIARELVAAQRGFLDGGVAHLKPLLMQDVARTVGMHASTVSRAIQDKYIDTPQGTFPMRYFFTSGFEAAGGGEESDKSVLSRIRELVEKEDPRSPLSDGAISKRLTEAGIRIARRTIAKYREKVGILSSKQRKKY